MGVITGEVDLFAEGESSAMTTAMFDQRREIEAVVKRVEILGELVSTARNKVEGSFRKHYLLFVEERRHNHQLPSSWQRFGVDVSVVVGGPGRLLV